MRNRVAKINFRSPAVLAVDMAGRPTDWLRWQDAVRHYVLGEIGWTVGEPVMTIHGGHNRCGRQSMIDLHPVVALHNADGGRYVDFTPPLTNRGLFARDRHICLYCGEHFPLRLLSRDHIQPRSRGGVDAWENVVTACKACNGRKADRTPEQAGMKLLALPYAPNFAESLILANKHILADQMTFLAAQVPRDRRDRV